MGIESPRGAPPSAGGGTNSSIEPEEIKREKLLNDWRYSKHLKKQFESGCRRWGQVQNPTLSLDNVT